MSTTARYFDLSTPAPRRLAMMRDAFEQHAEKYPHCPDYAKPRTWRDIRRTTHQGLPAYIGMLSRGFNTCQYSGKKTPVWYTHCGPAFPRELFADEFIGDHGRPLIEHKGWFADADCSSTIRGLIVRLPRGRFLAGYYQAENGERVYYPEIYDCIRDAVYAADGLAENMAELEREHSERWHAARELENEISDAENRLRECLALRNRPCFERLRTEAAGLIERIRNMRESLKTDYADYAA